LREGKLFQVETEYFSGKGPATESSRKTRKGHRVEHYWLCDACFPFVTLTFDQQRGVITVPLPDGAGQKKVKIVPLEQVGPTTLPTDGSFQPSVREVGK
jgi:hypothetical protein